jgi:hypothetical protein
MFSLPVRANYTVPPPQTRLGPYAHEFFKFAKLIRKIPNELGCQKRNASRSLPVITFSVSVRSGL